MSFALSIAGLVKAFGQTRALDGLDLVKFDAGLDQRLAVELILGVDRNAIGGSQRIGDHDDPHAALAHACQEIDALLSRHEVGRDEQGSAFGVRPAVDLRPECKPREVRVGDADAAPDVHVLSPLIRRLAQPAHA